MASWRELLSEATLYRGESLADLVANTLSESEMDVEFDDDWGVSNGAPFTAWSENFVYFPAVYDGLELVASVPRNPCDINTGHVGGE